MPNISITKSYQDGDILLESDLDNIRNDVTNFLNVTKIDSDNIQDSGVENAKLATDSVTEPKIANDAVTTDKIAANAATKAKIEVAQQFQAGMLMPYTGATAPTGWLLCDGSTVSRTTYADLYAVIGDAYGEGDGATTFHLPDTRGRFLRGVDDASGEDPDAGSRTAKYTGGATGDNVGSYQDDIVGGHSHVADRGSDTGGNSRIVTTNNVDLGNGNVGISSTGTGIGNETRPKNVYVNYIIKT